MSGVQYILNIGNTRCAVTTWDDAAARPDCRSLWHCMTPEFDQSWQPLVDGDWQATASCVVPSLRARVETKWPGRFHFVSPADYPWISLGDYDIPRLGADRLANIAAAAALLPGQSVLVIDCGTALNTVAVDKNGVFRGGVIIPGRETALASLSQATAQLPQCAVTAQHQLNPLGQNTVEGILNGVDLAILGAVEKIINATRAQDGFQDCRVWFTGGDGPFFAEHLPPALKAELAPLPLTLYGIGLATQRGK